MGRFGRGAEVRGRRATVVRSVLACVTAVMVTGFLSGTAGAVAAGTGRTTVDQGAMSDPTAGHAYRHGAVPLRTSPGAQRNAGGSRTGTSPTGRTTAGLAQKGPVSFGGGTVVTGSPKVYLVFWGARWGTQRVGAGGYDDYSGDPDGLAPNLQALLAGLGTDGEQWSAILSQYCQGVAVGATTCPLSPSSGHVAYPSSAVLAGVWEDASTNLAAATGTQIAQEAANAAVHFSDPPGAQYVIVSPTGTDPDQWLSPRYGYCAYHDNTGDPALGAVRGPNVPYTNMPYVPDVGAECSSFPSPRIVDGADETITHEYAETLTDPYPSTGWTDRHDNEVADKCEDLVGGHQGGSRYVTLATGTFAMQGIWANDLGRKGGCENAHALILTTNPGKQKSTAGTPLTLPMSALDLRGQTLTYSATDLPAGVAINTVTGLVSGTPGARERTDTTVTVSDSSSSTSFSFEWTIKR